MGIFANFKAQKAYKLHAAKNYEAALPLYREAYKDGMDSPRMLLAFCSLLIRMGEYQEARDLIVKVQKWPGFSPEQKTQLFSNYGVVVCKLGDVNKGVSVLERQAAKAPTGLVFQTLGYLYVVKLENRPSPDEPAPVVEKPPKEPGEEEEDEEEEEEPAPLTPYEQWQLDLEKGKALLEKALEYDDEDAICLDNMAQFHYRVMGDKAKAKEYFDKAIAIKPGQIDTLWFLSRYDVEQGNKAAAIEKLKTAAQGNFSALNYVTRQDVTDEIRRLGGTVED